MPNTTSYADLMDRIMLTEWHWQTHAAQHRSPYAGRCPACQQYQYQLETLRALVPIAQRIA